MELTSNKINDFHTKEYAVFQNLLDQAEGVIYRFQYFPEEDRYTIPYASGGLWNVYELKPHEVQKDATLLFDRIHKDDIKAFLNLIKESTQLMIKKTFEYRVVSSSKGIRWVKGYGLPVKEIDGSYFWNSCVMDITQQKQLEQDLFENKQRLELVVESTQDNIWEWNVQTNEIVYSDKSKKMFGYEPADFKNVIDTWKEKVHPEDRKQYYEAIDEHFEGKSKYYSNEYRIRCKDGSYKWILDRGKIIERDVNGTALRVVGTHSDITSKKTKEEESKQTVAIIGEQNNRLINFAHIVSHNLQNHSGNLEMLMEIINTSTDQKEKEEVLHHVNRVSNALTETIKHLNEIVNVQTSVNKEIQEINLYDYIQRTIHVLEGDILKREAVILNQVSSDIIVKYNATYLESILLNLMSNALKYQHPERIPEIKLEAFYEKDQLVFQITDNGKGIDLDKNGKSLFGMYKTFHDNKDAVGIGLFITKNQIQSMGSTIEVQSKLNIGTCFKITF